MRLAALVSEGVVSGQTADDGAERKQEFHRLGKRLMSELAKALGSRSKPTSNLGGPAVGGEVLLTPLAFPGLEIVFPSTWWGSDASPHFYYRRVDRLAAGTVTGPNHWCDYARLKDVPAVAKMLVKILKGRPIPFSCVRPAPKASTARKGAR